MKRFQIYMSGVYTRFKIHSVDLTGVRRRVPRFCLDARSATISDTIYSSHFPSSRSTPLKSSNYPPNTKYRTQGNFSTPDDQLRIAQVTENLTNDQLQEHSRDIPRYTACRDCSRQFSHNLKLPYQILNFMHFTYTKTDFNLSINKLIVF